MPDRADGTVRGLGGGDEMGRRCLGVPGDDRLDRHRELRPGAGEAPNEVPAGPDAVENEQEREGCQTRPDREGDPPPVGPWAPPTGRGRV